VHILRSRWLSLTVPVLLLVCSVGLIGCDSKPPDGAQVKDSGHIDPEQKAKVKAYYADRHPAATKTTSRKK
jgi:hypothetical protein